MNYLFAKHLLLRRPVKAPSAYTSELQDFLNDKFFRAALRLATPVFFAILEKQDFKAKALNEKEVTTLQKYINRYCFRPTPFGLFSSVTLAEWSASSQSAATPKIYYAHIRTAMQVQNLWTSHLLENQLLDGDKLEANPTIYRVLNEYRFIRTALNDSGKQRDYQLQSIAFSKVLKDIIAKFREPGPRNELVKQIIKSSYSRMESKTAKVFDKIRAVDQDYNLDETDIPMLQYFAAELFWRLPAQQPVLAKMAETPSLKQLGITLSNKDTGETVNHSEIEQRILQHPNYTKLLRTMMPLKTYPRLFDCKSPVTIFTFPKGLPAICSDNPLILRHPEKHDLYQDDFILPLTENKILIRIKKLKSRFWSTVKIDIDMLVLMQANEYACCVDEHYPAMLKDLFQKKYRSTDRLRANIFESIDEEFPLGQSGA